MSETVIIISYKCLFSFLEKFKLQRQHQRPQVKESPGTTDDLSGRGERMQKPHVEQPSVNSEDVVKLREGCLLFFCL